jgi:hypothetical protein
MRSIMPTLLAAQGNISRKRAVKREDGGDIDVQYFARTQHYTQFAIRLALLKHTIHSP